MTSAYTVAQRKAGHLPMELTEPSVLRGDTSLPSWLCPPISLKQWFSVGGGADAKVLFSN